MTLDELLTKIAIRDLNLRWGQVNERFDERAEYLYGLGFRNTRTSKPHCVSIFVRDIPGRSPEIFTASCLLYAEEILWNDLIKNLVSKT